MRRPKRSDLSNDVAKFVAFLALFIAFSLGFKSGLPGILRVLVVELAILGFGWLFAKKLLSTQPAVAGPSTSRPTPSASDQPWTEARIIERLRAIDWYHFEKFNAAILEKEGWSVERKGGATPDGGVDLVATKSDVVTLVQCKHWKTWTVQEKVIRELLGSMAHFRASRGALHTLKGWTKPAGQFAAEHDITLCDERDLARRACTLLSVAELEKWLLSDAKCCPKCESPMVWRTGDFEPFWGCSKFPRCRGVIRS